VDLSWLVLVASRVRGRTPEQVLGELDLDAAQRCLDAACREGADSPRRQASALLTSIVQEHPFAHDNDLIALMVAAQLLGEVGLVVTFEPTAELSALLDQLRSREAVVDDVLDFIASNSECHEEKPSMFERFTPRARHVLSEAKHAAEDLRHNFIGTEHLLLGLLAVEDGIAAQVLRDLGVVSGEVKRRIQELVGSGPKAVVDNFPFTPRSKKVLELAFRHSLSYGHDYIGTEHLLLGLVDVTDGVSGQILKTMGVTGSRVEEKVTATLLAQGWMPPSKKARRRLRLPGFPAVTFSPTGPATQARNQRLAQELTAIISENDTLRAEVDRLRRLLEAHNIDPGQPAPGEQPA
jgi:hypothetical protein